MNIPLLLAAALLAAAPSVRAEDEEEVHAEEAAPAPHIEAAPPRPSAPTPSPAASWSPLSADRVRVPKPGSAPRAQGKTTPAPPASAGPGERLEYCAKPGADPAQCRLDVVHRKGVQERMSPQEYDAWLKRAQGAAAANTESQKKDEAQRLKADAANIEKKRAAAVPPPPPSNKEIELGEVNGRAESCFSQNGANQEPLAAPDPRYAVQELREKPGRYGARRCVLRGSSGIVVMVPDDYSTDWRDYKKHRYVLDHVGSTVEVNHLPAGFARPGTPGLRYWTDSRNYTPGNEMENMALTEVGLQSYWYATAPNGYRAAAYPDASARFLAWGRAGYPHTDADGCVLDVRGEPVKDLKTGLFLCAKR